MKEPHKATPEEIVVMLTTTRANRNLFHNERRLVILALIRANYNYEEAFKLNDVRDMEMDGYLKKIYRYGVNIEEIKKAVDIIKAKPTTDGKD